jgi:sigma-B regulation protein RsbU (phosphoserine phosphatase)
VAAHLELASARKTLAAQNKVLRESLAVAADVQRTLVPKAPAGLPGLDVAGLMTPCDAVGGDYLDFLTGDDFAGRGLGVAVGDVMGHGPAAALLMTAARACLRMRASRPGSVAEVVTDVNRDKLWPVLDQMGWRPARQVAIDDVWSGMRFSRGKSGLAKA